MVTVYETELNKKQVDMYLRDKDQFLEDSSEEDLNFSEIEVREESNDWIRIYTDGTPY